MGAPALDRLGLHMLDLDSIAAVRAGAPSQQTVALHEAVSDQVQLLQLHPGVADQGYHSVVVHHDVAVARALDHLAGSLVHDLGGEVLCPAAGAVQVATLQACHHALGQRQAADLALHHRRGAGGSLGLGQVGVLLVRGYNLGLIEHGLLVIGVEPLHQLLLVPLEVVEQYPHSSGWYLQEHHWTHHH